MSSYDIINEFTEISGENNLLEIKRCSYSHSDSKETVEDRCNLEIMGLIWAERCEGY